MISYMDLNEQADIDFSRARRRALLRRVLARLRRKTASNRLLRFDFLRRALRADNRRYLGTNVVEVEKIVGSVGRLRDFDGSFLPARSSIAQRWKRINRAFHRHEDLPPVELYKLGDAYFVVDGHHQVSVASYHGVPTLEAQVTEFHPKVSAAPAPQAGRKQKVASGRLLGSLMGRSGIGLGGRTGTSSSPSSGGVAQKCLSQAGS
jgi:hypothetical protein